MTMKELKRQLENVDDSTIIKVRVSGYSGDIKQVVFDLGTQKQVITLSDGEDN